MRVKITKLVILILLATALLPLLGACASGAKTSEGGSLVVNEIVSSNKRSLTDEALGTPDWIELYNAGTAPLDQWVNQGAVMVGAGTAEALSPAEAQALSLLASIDPDTLTPREALDALYKLKTVISS